MTKVHYGGGVIISALNARDFLRDHGRSLSELLQVIAGSRGLDLYCDADRLLKGGRLDPARVGVALREMRDLLADVETQDHLFTRSLRWHRARLSELESGLPR